MKESKGGNTILHIAAKKSNISAAEMIFKEAPSLCLVQNHNGDTPFHLAIKEGSSEVLHVMESKKNEALFFKNSEGENPLFLAAESGDETLFNWFSGKVDYYKARGERNYEG